MIGIEDHKHVEASSLETSQVLELVDDSGEKLDTAELPGDAGGELDVAELPDDSGEELDMAELPDDSGEELDMAELPDDSGEELDGAELPDDAGDQKTDAEEKQPEKNIESTEQLIEDYYKDLKEKSPCPETLPEKPADASEYERMQPEKVAEMREEFVDRRNELKKEWEQANGRPWPKYETDVYSQSGKLIRQAGSDYDAHHIQPLCLGGKNEASNITPMHASDHYDKQGIHAPNSPYSKLEQQLGGNAQ